MNLFLKNAIFLVLGIVIGMALNMGIIMISNSVIPYPEGMIPGDMDSLIKNLPSFEPKHFIMPFLAHALGTLVGAFIVAKFAASHHLRLVIVVGALFLVGGIKMALDVPGPTWFTVLDLVVAYIPMALLGHKLAGR